MCIWQFAVRINPPTAGTDVFALDATSASGSTGNAFDAPFPVDMEWHQDWGSSIGQICRNTFDTR